MARARNIKPGLYRNEEMIELPIAARYLFTGLWTMADRRGRLEDRPKKIRLELLPYDDVDVDGLLNGLATKGFLVRYEVEGLRYIQIINFEKHQRPHQNESESVIPAPPCDGVPSLDSNTFDHGDKPGEPRGTALRSDSLIPDCLNLNADGADGADVPDARAREAPPPDDDPEPDIPDLTETELYVVQCVQAVPGAAGLKPAEIVAELRESVLNRGSPVPDDVIRQQFQRFRNYWSEKRKSQRGKWRGWRNAISNWVGRIQDTEPVQSRNGNGKHEYDPTKIWLEWAEDPNEQGDVWQGHGVVIDVATPEER